MILKYWVSGLCFLLKRSIRLSGRYLEYYQLLKLRKTVYLPYDYKNNLELDLSISIS